MDASTATPSMPIPGPNTVHLNTHFPVAPVSGTLDVGTDDILRFPRTIDDTTGVPQELLWNFYSVRPIRTR